MIIWRRESVRRPGLSEIALPLAASLVLLVVLLAVNQIDLGHQVLEKYPPDATPAGLMRTAGCAAAAALFAFALKAFAGSPARDMFDHAFGARSFAAVYAGSLAIIVFTGAIMVVAPASLIFHVEELGPVGLMQEAALFAALLLAGAAGLAARRRNLPGIPRRLASLIVVLICGALFLLLMEELSWGQHFFGWRTPAMFEENIQNETNLHNFYTNRFEFLFYAAAILAFVVVPFAWPGSPPAMLRPVSLFIPPRAFAIAALPAAAYLYEIWNIVPMQAGFFLALAIGLMIAAELRRRRPALAALALIMLAVTIACQAAFLTNGDQLAVSYEIEEMRETEIAWLILAYAAWLLVRVRGEGSAVA